MTRNHCSFTFTQWPMGSSALKRSSARLRRARHTGAPASAPPRVKKRPATTREPGDLLVARLDAEHLRRLLLRLRHQLLRREALARGGRGDARDARADAAQVALGQAGRGLPRLLERLEVGGFPCLDDDVAHAELLDERQHLLLRAGADRHHRDDRRDAEDHPEHREQGAQLVREQRLEPALDVGQQLQPRRPSRAKPGAFMRLPHRPCRRAASGPGGPLRDASVRPRADRSPSRRRGTR